MTRVLYIIVFIIFSNTSFGQKKAKIKQPFDEKSYAKRFLNKALSDTLEQARAEGYVFLNDTAEVIKFAEPILIKLYGEETVKSEKPYKLYKFDTYWVMLGTLHYDLGGTFMIAIDSRDYRVISVIHEK